MPNNLNNEAVQINEPVLLGRISTEDKVNIVKFIVAGILLTGGLLYGAYSFLEKDYNRASVGSGGEIESIAVGDGSMPFFSHDIMRLECNGGNLETYEQGALFMPIYVDALGNSGGTRRFKISDCTLGNIQATLNSQTGFDFTKHVLSHPKNYGITLE